MLMLCAPASQFEGLTANTLPVLSTATPPTPYQGLNYAGAVVVKNAPSGQYITDIQTTQGSQFVAVNTLSSITLSTPNAGETFKLKSAYVAIYLSTDNSVIVPAEDGVLAFTGTKPDGSKVVETVQYTASGTGITKTNGVVVQGKALLQQVTFSNLSGLTSVVVTVQSAQGTSAVISLLNLLGFGISSATDALALDSLSYDVTS